MADLLEIEGVCAGYEKADVLQGVSFAVKAHSITCLLGANGAGKTTVVRSILGLTPPRAGRIVFDGHDITGLATHRIVAAGVACIPEGRKVFPKLTVEENLLLGAFRPAARADIAKNLALCYETFDVLKERRRQLAGSMSGGQQQMLAIARALISDPKVLILDEPTEGLQPSIIKELARTLNVLRAERGFAILVSEQVLSFALDLADRFLVIDRGRFVHEEARATLDQEKVRSFLTV